MRLALLAVLLLALTGCGDDGEQPAPDRGDERVIRGWSKAVNAGQYERAASFFAPGAVVEQQSEFRLRDREAAEFFNRTLPCRADVTGVEDEGRTSLATFRLREGREGECGPGDGEGEIAKVRFLIRDGQIREWRQLPQEPAPEGEVV
jgi:hypothetical protein